MKISGLQKLTLLDYPGHIACTIFTNGCNYRCPFCQNASLVLRPMEQPEITEDELFSFLKKRVGILQGVCITGGEPTLHSDLIRLIQKIKQLGFFVKLDTNGSSPDMLDELITKHLIDYVAMDIKNSKEKYGITVGLQNFDITYIEKSADILMKGSLPYEFRTTLVKEFHNAEDLLSIGRWLSGSEKYFLQSFKDSGDLIQEGLHEHTKQELLHFKELVSPYFKLVELRGVS